MPVTIAIPFYNAEKFLPDAIRSVFAQTYTDWELLLIDDGSTDRSLEIAKSIKDDRVRVFSDGKNLKLASRLNQITKLAKYEFIARMDADDLMSPMRIEKEINLLENNSDIDLVTTGLFSISDNLKLLGYRWFDKPTISHDELLNRNMVVHAAMMGRKSWYERNPYDTTLAMAQDYNLWLSSSYKDDFRIQFLPEPLYYYREEGNIQLTKMLAVAKYNRFFFRKYGQKRSFMLIFTSYIKDAIIVLLFCLGIKKIILTRRNKTLKSGRLLTQFESEINQIKSITIPGLI